MEEILRSLELDPACLPVGTRIGPWRVTGRRGRGTYGTVYRVERDEGGEAGPFALKLALHPGDERFAREAELLRRIHHPHVPRLHGQGLWQHSTGAYPYLVMQWVEGVPLYEWAARSSPTSRQVLKVLAQVTRALEATHAAGGAHRDVKGDNVLVRLADGHAFLMDFGAGSFRGAATLTEQVLPPGTPTYRSPEAWAFQLLFWRHPTARYVASPCDDLFALGITAYRLVTGQYPPPTQPGERGAEVWRQGGHGPLPPRALNPHVCPELDGLIRALLAVCPMERFRGSTWAAARAMEEAVERAGPSADVPLPVAELMSSEVASARASWATVEEVEEVRGPGEPEREPPREEGTGGARMRPPALERAGWGGLVEAVGVLLGVVAGTWLSARQPVARADLEAEGRDGGVTAVGDRAATAPISTLSFEFATDGVPGVGLPMPERPFPGQRTPPCNRSGEEEIRGGCWYELARARSPCKEDAYDWKGACYLPSFPPRRQPTSEQP